MEPAIEEDTGRGIGGYGRRTTSSSCRDRPGGVKRSGRPPTVPTTICPVLGVTRRTAGGSSEGNPPRTRRRRQWPRRLLLLGLSSFLCLSVLEVGFRLLGYRPVYGVYSKPEAFWRDDELLGWSLQPGATGLYVGPRPYPIEYRTPVRINSSGFRGADIVDLPPGGLRAVALGDSLVAGFEVPEQSTYPALLERHLNESFDVPVQVINAGVQGYGTDQAYLLYREDIRRLHPDVVVFHASPNDPEDDTTLHRMRRPFGKPAFTLGPDGSLTAIGYPVRRYPTCSAYRLDAQYAIKRIDSSRARAFCWAQSRLADHSAFLTFVTTRIERNPRLVKAIYNLGTPSEQAAPVGQPPPGPAQPHPSSSSGPPVTPTLKSPDSHGTDVTPQAVTQPAARLDYTHRLTSALIGKLAEAVVEDGARFVLVIDAADLRQLDRNAFDRSGMTIVLTDDAHARDPDAQVRNDGHMNELGHRRLADFLAPRLEGLLKP